jgi:anthranilate/para-aminobenzoate synthase component II
VLAVEVPTSTFEVLRPDEFLRILLEPDPPATADREVMGVRRRSHPVEGVQLHSESVATSARPEVATYLPR